MTLKDVIENLEEPEYGATEYGGFEGYTVSDVLHVKKIIEKISDNNLTIRLLGSGFQGQELGKPLNYKFSERIGDGQHSLHGILYEGEEVGRISFSRWLPCSKDKFIEGIKLAVDVYKDKKYVCVYVNDKIELKDFSVKAEGYVIQNHLLNRTD